ncbi:MAG: ankyrin repeat domain-containing protein [Gammaproteobacteria bacterium]|nr:ankyrin repeat domain-containing protein [Gammaproteobacteria bacterium]
MNADSRHRYSYWAKGLPYLIGRYFPRGTFDFIVFVIPRDYATHFWNGKCCEFFSMHAANDSEGADFVATGFVTVLDTGGGVVFPGGNDRGRDLSYNLLTHELLHKWTVAGLPDGCVRDIRGRGTGHWGFSSANGIHGGYDKNTLEDRGGGVYVMNRFSEKGGYGHLSPIELYSMGLATADEAPSLDCLVNARDASHFTDGLGNEKMSVRADGVRTYSMAQYLQSISSWRETHVAQKERKTEFRMLAVAPVFDTKLPGAIANFDNDVLNAVAQTLERYEDLVTRNSDEDGFISFYEATNGRATMKTSIEDVFLDSGEARHCSVCESELLNAVRNLYANFVQVLIEAGADVNEKDVYGNTPLHWATLRGDDAAIAKLLIEAGSDTETQDSRGSTPLHWAVSDGNLSIARLLIEAGADVNRQRTDGAAPLHLAVLHVEMARALIDDGANIELRDSRGNTPLHWAAYYGGMDTAKLLIDEGANLNAKHNNGNTPLDFAEQQGHEDIAKLLRDAGAEESEE